MACDPPARLRSSTSVQGGLHVPDQGRQIVLAGGDQLHAVGGEGQRRHLALMSFQLGQDLSGGHVVHQDPAFGSSRRQRSPVCLAAAFRANGSLCMSQYQPSIGQEAQRLELTQLRLVPHLPHLLAGLDVPQVNERAPCQRCQQPAVGRKRQTAHSVRSAAEILPLLAGGDVPQRDRSIRRATARGQPRAVRRETQDAGPALVALHPAGFCQLQLPLLLRDLPKANAVLRAARGQLSAVW